MSDTPVKKPLLPGGSRRDNDEAKVGDDGMLLPDFQCDRPLRVIGVQKETPVCWSRDGKKLCFVLGNKTLVVHEAIADGPRAGEFQVKSLLRAHQDIVKALSFNPTDSNMLVSGGYEGILVWDVAAQRMVKKIHIDNRRDAHTSDVLCFEWACDGTSLLTGSKDSDVKVWDVNNDFKLLETIVGHKASVLSITYSPVSKLIATAGRDSTIKVWDGTTLAVTMRAQRADDSGIKCSLVHNLDGHRGDVVTLTWQESGYVLFSGARDNTVKVWDARSGVELRELEQRSDSFGKHRGDVRKMICIPGSPYMITGSLDSTMKVWRVAPTEAVATLELTESKRDEAEAALLQSILGDGESVQEAKAVAESDQLVKTVEIFTDEGVYDMALNPAAPILATSSSTNAVRLWRVSNFAAPTVLQEFRGHLETVNEACLLDDVRLVTVSNDYFVHMYNIDSSEQPRHFSFDSSVLCAAVRPTGKRAYVFAGGADYSIKAFAMDAEDERAVRAGGRTTHPDPHEYVAAKFMGHSGRVTTIALNGEGTLMASGGFDYTIMLWKLEEEYPACTPERPESAIPVIRPTARVDAHKGHIMCMRFKPGTGEKTSYLATCSNDHSLKVWKVSRGMMRGYSLSEHWSASEVHQSAVSAVCWGKATGSNTLFSSSWDRTVCQFDLNPRIVAKEAQPMRPPLTCHGARVTDMDVSVDGRFLVTVSVDVTAVVWDIMAGLKPVCKYIMSVTDGFPSAVAAGNKLFVSASGFGQIMVWPLPVAEHMDRMQDYEQEGAVTLAAVVEQEQTKDQIVAVGGGDNGASSPSAKKDTKHDEDTGAGVGISAGAGAGVGVGAAPAAVVTQVSAV